MEVEEFLERFVKVLRELVGLYDIYLVQSTVKLDELNELLDSHGALLKGYGRPEVIDAIAGLFRLIREAAVFSDTMAAKIIPMLREAGLGVGEIDLESIFKEEGDGS